MKRQSVVEEEQAAVRRERWFVDETADGERVATTRRAKDSERSGGRISDQEEKRD